MVIKYILLKRKKILFDYSGSLKPTKNIVRECFFSWIFNFIDSLYVVDLFSGSCVFGFEFFNFNSKKILNIEINKCNIDNILLNLNTFDKSFFNNFFLIHMDSYIWITTFNVLNFSLVIFDPPYVSKVLYFLELKRVIFLRKCLIMYVETNSFLLVEFFFNEWFLIRKSVIGKVLFFLVKKI